MSQIGRNAQCPCGSGLKYKICCLGKIPWEDYLNQNNFDAIVRHKTIRGKNQLFINAILAAFGLNSNNPPETFVDFKKACTPKAVQLINKALVDIWPDQDDCIRVLELEQPKTTGLYVGMYEPRNISRGIARHALYSDCILICDPFPYPMNLAPKFNPLEHPESYQTTTLQFASLWLGLWPWIEDGIVKIIRSPIEYDILMLRSLIQESYGKYEKDGELKRLAEKYASEVIKNSDGTFEEYALLLHSNEALAAMFRKNFPNKNESELNDFLKYMDKRRDTHPYFIPDMDLANKPHGEYSLRSSGASYDMAKVITGITDSYIITDIPSKWRELELDRESGTLPRHEWQPFAKAFQNLNLKFLNNVPLKTVLQIRKENRLLQMRSFFGKVWRESKVGCDTDEDRTKALGDELSDKVAEAESEWGKIDKDLAKWLGYETVGTGAVVAERIANGGGNWIWPALGLAGMAAISLSASFMNRKSFKNRFPAGFFLGKGK